MGKCNHLILHCMDYRIQAAVNEWIQANGYLGNIDRISIAGACRQRQTALEFIAVGCEKHDVKNVFLIQHHDCAGYGGSDAFQSIQAEKDKLVSDMLELKNLVEQSCKGVEITMLLAEKTGSSWKVVELEMKAIS